MRVRFVNGRESLSVQWLTKLTNSFSILLIHVKAGIEKVGQPLTGRRCLGGILEDVLEFEDHVGSDCSTKNTAFLTVTHGQAAPTVSKRSAAFPT